MADTPLALVAKERTEAGLNEMAICRQGFFEPVLLHDDKRNAIDERPRLVRASGKKRDTFLKERLAGWDQGG